MLSKKVPEIIDAFEVLKVVSSDEETRRDAEIRIKAMSDRASSLAGAREEGMQQGMQQGIYNVAKNLLDILDNETIALKTGLPIEEIQKMRKSNEDLVVRN